MGVGEKIYRMDHCFPDHAPQQEVYSSEWIEGRVTQALEQGVDLCLFAYGQTGSGKTMTMHGDYDKPDGMGIVPRVLARVYERAPPPVRLGVVEIYNEQVRDLLGSLLALPTAPANRSPAAAQSGARVPLHAVSDLGLARGLLCRAQAAVRVGSHLLNARSSRAHTLTILQAPTVPTTIYLVDLAGTERSSVLVPAAAGGRTVLVPRLNLSGVRQQQRSAVVAATAQDGGTINQSLTTLCACLRHLVARQRGHHRTHPASFRQSKLTYLLRESLSFGMITMIATVAAFAEHGEHSLRDAEHTLAFADGIRGYRTAPAGPRGGRGPPEAARAAAAAAREAALRHLRWWEEGPWTRKRPSPPPDPGGEGAAQLRLVLLHHRSASFHCVLAAGGAPTQHQAPGFTLADGERCLVTSDPDTRDGDTTALLLEEIGAPHASVRVADGVATLHQERGKTLLNGVDAAETETLQHGDFVAFLDGSTGAVVATLRAALPGQHQPTRAGTASVGSSSVSSFGALVARCNEALEAFLLRAPSFSLSSLRLVPRAFARGGVVTWWVFVYVAPEDGDPGVTVWHWRDFLQRCTTTLLPVPAGLTPAEWVATCTEPAQFPQWDDRLPGSAPRCFLSDQDDSPTTRRSTATNCFSDDLEWPAPSLFPSREGALRTVAFLDDLLHLRGGGCHWCPLVWQPPPASLPATAGRRCGYLSLSFHPLGTRECGVHHGDRRRTAVPRRFVVDPGRELAGIELDYELYITLPPDLLSPTGAEQRLLLRAVEIRAPQRHPPLPGPYEQATLVTIPVDAPLVGPPRILAPCPAGARHRRRRGRELRGHGDADIPPARGVG